VIALDKVRSKDNMTQMATIIGHQFHNNEEVEMSVGEWL
jgi:hypothetical protein